MRLISQVDTAEVTLGVIVLWGVSHSKFVSSAPFNKTLRDKVLTDWPEASSHTSTSRTVSIRPADKANLTKTEYVFLSL